jgi:hypothetical protein
MFLSNISILFFATFMLIGISAMAFPSVYQVDDEQDNTEIQEILRQPNEFGSWLHKRHSPLCDYRLQFRPLPLTSALCGYGLFNFY